MRDQFVALGVIRQFAADAQPLFALQAVVPRIGLNPLDQRGGVDYGVGTKVDAGAAAIGMYRADAQPS